jgi:hypothetical protein
MKKFTLVFLALFLGSFLVFNAPQAQAYTIGFYRITDNATDNVASQLSVEVRDLGGNGVAFRFFNTAVISSSITQIYFDDGSLLAQDIITDSGTSVAFSPGANPNLPGGNNVSPPFDATDAFSASANNPAVANGVNANFEWVQIAFTLQNDQDYNDVISDIVSGALRIGMHVQGISTTSDSFVNLAPIPIPAAAWLLGSGLLGLVAIRRRVKK